MLSAASALANMSSARKIITADEYKVLTHAYEYLDHAHRKLVSVLRTDPQIKVITKECWWWVPDSFDMHVMYAQDFKKFFDLDDLESRRIKNNELRDHIDWDWDATGVNKVETEQRIAAYFKLHHHSPSNSVHEDEDEQIPPHPLQTNFVHRDVRTAWPTVLPQHSYLVITLHHLLKTWYVYQLEKDVPDNICEALASFIVDLNYFLSIAEGSVGNVLQHMPPPQPVETVKPTMSGKALAQAPALAPKIVPRTARCRACLKQIKLDAQGLPPVACLKRCPRGTYCSHVCAASNAPQHADSCDYQ
jgi:hypothetical protein